MYANYRQKDLRARRRMEMVSHDTLIFQGRKWQAVRVTERAPLGRFGFTAGGEGREWKTERPLAFWRTFAGIDLVTNPDAALRFISRHGDPFGELDRKERTGSTAKWKPLQTALSMIAQAWDDTPLDDNGGKISRISEDEDRHDVARHALYELTRPDLKGGLEGVEVIAHGDGLAIRATSLASLMIASAASALQGRIGMRTCDFCGDWFELRKSTARFCSGSCQAVGYKHSAVVAGPEYAIKSAFRELKGKPRGRS
jgi:hypothetical protein